MIAIDWPVSDWNLDFKFSQASQLFAEAEQARLWRLGGYES